LSLLAYALTVAVSNCRYSTLFAFWLQRWLWFAGHIRSSCDGIIAACRTFSVACPTV